MADGRVVIAVDWDDSEVSSGIKDTQKEIEKKLDDVEINAEVKATDKGIKDLQDQLDSIEDVTVQASVEADAGTVADLQKTLDKVDDISINADINIDDSGIKQVSKVLDDLDTSVSPKVNIDDSDIDQARKKLEDLEDPINVPIKADTSGLDLGGALGVAGAVTGILALADSTAEYNSDLAVLRTNTELAGESFEYAEEQLKNLNAITGETDSNVEALSNLMQAGFTGNNLGSAVEQLSGAVIAFPDTLKIESLADSLQETIATGAGIGQFSELIERSGESLDEFNVLLSTGLEFDYLVSEYEKFASTLGKDIEPPSFDEWVASVTVATTELERQEIALKYLEELDFSNVNDQYREQNSALIANKDAQFELNSALAEMGTALTPLVTSLMPLLTQLVTELTPPLVAIIGDLLPPLQSIITALMPVLTQLISVLMPLLMSLIDTLLPPLIQIIEMLLPPLMAIITALLPPIVELTNMALVPLLNVFMQLLDPLLQLIGPLLPVLTTLLTSLTPIVELLTTAIQIVSGVLTGVFSAAVQNVTNLVTALTGIFQGLIQFITGVFTGNWTQAWQGLVTIIGNQFNAIVAVVKAPLNSVIGMINVMIGALNSVFKGIGNIDIPDWVPVIGGNSFSIPTIPNVPYLARGGIVNRATQAVIGEDGAEAVIPLEKNTQGMQMIADLISEQIGVADNQMINLTLQLDGATIYKKMIEFNKKNTQRTGKNAMA